jgi:signal transduction histidine kinase
VDALLDAALRLIGPGEIAALTAVHTGRIAALYGLGRLEEGDEEYQTIKRLGATALQRTDATAVQVLSLTHRTRFTEAADLGLESLRELGITVPAAEQLSAELGHHLGHLYRWLDQTEGTDDLARPDITDPALLGILRLIYAVQPSTAFADNFAMNAWLSLEGLRIWLEHGPCPTLVGPASAAAFVPLALRGEYATGYRILQRILALSEARGYNPGVARFLFAAFCCWFEPIENSVQAGRRAREELLAGGDLANVGYTYHPVVAALLDCAPSLDACVAEMEAGLAFASRTGNEEANRWLDSYRWLAGVLRGENASAAGEAVPLDRYAGSPLALSFAHLTRTIAAAIFGDLAGLERHIGAAMPLLTAQGSYTTALARLLRVLALAGQARATDGSDRGGLLAELDEETRWLAERATNAPDNFLHLLRLAEAERAWAAGDFRAAALAFDAARREAAGRRRPWHRALIAERAARFHLARGLEHAGYELLAQARQEYLTWGATAKAAHLDWAYPALQPNAAAAHSADQPGDLAYSRDAVTAGTIDMLGILSASQALSSETSIGRLHARVTQVLGAITGATGVHLALWSEDRQDWLLPVPGGGTVPVGGTGRETAVPLSVLRYVQRTREPLVAGDPPRDDRFARDPYFADLPCCSLLAVPILSRGALRAVLLLENRLLRGAFTADRLEAVRLIAGQLAVSLDNAQLYAELTASRARIVAAGDQVRHRIERDLHDGAQQRLVTLALQLRAVQAAVSPELGAQLDRAVAEAVDALEELRELAHGIHPAILARGGLGPALKALARRCPIPVGLRVDVDDRLPEPVEVSAYYVVAEALTNTAKHARASAVSVEAEAVEGILRVTVRDGGAGGAGFTGGTGLAGLKDRVEALGGRIFLDSPAGAGTSLRAEFPLTARSSTSSR